MKPTKPIKDLEQHDDAALARACARILVVFMRGWLARPRAFSYHRSFIHVYSR